MHKNDYRTGERVTSTVGGFYMGMPGTIIAEAQIRWGYFRDYVIELDTGKKITMSARHIKPLDEKARKP